MIRFYNILKLQPRFWEQWQNNALAICIRHDDMPDFVACDTDGSDVQYWRCRNWCCCNASSCCHQLWRTRPHTKSRMAACDACIPALMNRLVGPGKYLTVHVCSRLCMRKCVHEWLSWAFGSANCLPSIIVENIVAVNNMYIYYYWHTLCLH